MARNARWTLVAGAALATIVAACTTYQDDLARGQKAFESNDYERTLAIFRDIEGDTSLLSVEDQARYAYLRGMTDYRIGYKADARHWLSMARSINADHPTALSADWKKRMTDALNEMNEAVYTSGYSALTNTETGEATTNPDDVPLAKNAKSTGDGGASAGDTTGDAGAATSAAGSDASAASD